MHPALDVLREATWGTPYEGRLWLVGGAVRDRLLGLPDPNDLDIVLEDSALDLAQWTFEQGLSAIPPVVYPRFGTALIRIGHADVELATARRESYDPESRKPFVAPATLEQDALRRDFTVNTLLLNLHSNELRDPLGSGLGHLANRILQTPLDPDATFRDDPLRMLRAVRFRWQLGFVPAEGLYESIRETRQRLAIISAERIRDELGRMLSLPDADRALADLATTELLEVFAPELNAMRGVEQGNFHHLDVWDHTLLALRRAGCQDPVLSWAVLLHDVGKPATRVIDAEGRTRFFGHEAVSATVSRDLLRRLKLPTDQIDAICKLVKNHMRLTSSPEFTASAARRLIRDMGDELERLLQLVEADAQALKPGVKELDLSAIRARLAQVSAETPRQRLESPLSGQEIMDVLGIGEGPEIGQAKSWLVEKVLDGALQPGDRQCARELLLELRRKKPS